jgi:MTH538 TIR-like domain (DUF1863)
MARRVFVSFQFEDVRYATLMDAWAANENDEFTFYGERLKVAVNSTEATYIRRVLKAKIRRARVLVCLIGADTARSRWVRWEIRTARLLGKGLVGVLLRPHNRHPVPIRNAGAVFVPYERAEIQRAIDWAADANQRSGDFSYRR